MKLHQVKLFDEDALSSSLNHGNIILSYYNSMNDLLHKTKYFVKKDLIDHAQQIILRKI